MEIDIDKLLNISNRLAVIETKVDIENRSAKEALDKALVGTEKAIDKAADDMNSKFASVNAVIEEQRKTINDFSIKVGNISGFQSQEIGHNETVKSNKVQSNFSKQTITSTVAIIISILTALMVYFKH